MQLQIRLAEGGDMPDILALQAYSLRSLSKDHYSDVHIEALVRSQAIARTAASEAGDELVYIGEFIVDAAEQAKTAQIVGIGALSLKMSGLGVIYALYVHPDFVRRGIARQLLATLEAKAIEWNCQSMYVISSLVAVLCYQSVGYRKLQNSRIRVEGHLIRCVHMAKSLPYVKPPFAKRLQKAVVFWGIVFAVALLIAFL
jgi:GNAT superfamily N-acetyltransferase